MRYRWFARGIPQNEMGLPMTRGEQEERDRALRARQKVGRGERFSLFIGALIFGYGLETGDRPMALMAAAFLVYELRLLAPLLPPRCRRPLCNAVRGFSFALFGGTLLIAFL